MLHKLLIRLIVLLLLVTVGPVNSGSLFAQDNDTRQAREKKKTPGKSSARNSSRQKKSKPSASRKKKRSGTKAKSGQAKASGKKRSAQQKKARPGSKNKQASAKARKARPGKSNAAVQRKKRPPQTAQKRTRPRTKKPAAQTRVPKVNSLKMADDIYTLTDELTSSNRQLDQAVSYLQPMAKRSAVRLESKPAFYVGELERQAELEPDNLRLQRQLGLEYEKTHQLNKAKDVYLRAAYRNPREADAHYYLGSFFTSVGDEMNARNAFQEALELDPNHQATIDMISSDPAIKSQFGSLAKKRTQEPDKKTDSAMLQMNAIQGEIEKKNYLSAMSLIQDAREKYPEQGGFAYLAGRVHQELNEFEDARKAYRKAIELNSDHSNAYKALAGLYYDQGNYLYAALSYGQVVRLNPMLVEFRHLQGISYYLAGEWGHAAAAWEDMLHFAPNHSEAKIYLPQVYYVLAMEYNRRGESALGRKSFEKAFSVNSDTRTWLPGALITLGKYYRENEMFKQSLSTFQEVIELEPKDSDSYTEIGITYWKMNEKRLARAAWQRSLELDPDNNSAQGWLIISRQAG